MSKLEAICFDFDGTLIDTIPLIVESYQYVYQRLGGYEPSPEEIISGIGLPLETIFLRNYPEERIPEILDLYLSYNRPRLVSGVAIFLGIVPMLQELKALGYPLGIITAKRGSDLTPTLEGFQLTPYFDVIISKFDTEKHKPDPAPLHLAAEHLGLQRAEAMLYIGDAVYDIQAAQNGGYRSGAVAWSQTPRAILEAENPDIFFEDWQDIVAYATRERG